MGGERRNFEFQPCFFFLAAHLPNAPHDTEAVEHAKVKHFTLFEQIAADHARIGAEREAERRALGLHDPQQELDERHQYDQYQH